MYTALFLDLTDFGKIQLGLMSTIDYRYDDENGRTPGDTSFD